MKCILCGKPHVIELQQGQLCRQCFIQYFQKKVYRTIRKHSLFGKDDVLCVACSGGKDSLAVLYLVNRIAKKRKQKLFALGIDEGVEGYRERQLDDMEKFCSEHGIDCMFVSFKDEFGKTIEELMKIARKKKVDVSQCALCGILRRKLLNTYARKMGATKMVVGHNLDDEAQTILMNMFKGGMELAARIGPETGSAKHKSFVPRVKPLYFCTEKETALYTKLMKFPVLYDRCPYRKDSYRDFIHRKLEEIEAEHKGSKTGLIQNFLDVLPLLREKYSGKKIPECSRCGEPSKGRVCKSCQLLSRLGTVSYTHLTLPTN